MQIFIPTFLVAIAAAIGTGLWYLAVADLPRWISAVQPVLVSVLMGSLGAAAYCIRAVYLNLGVHNRWSPNWYTWYFLRPAAGLIFGGVSYAILKAGLLLLDARDDSDGLNWGFVALAFIAGVNVDRFVRRMEEAAKATFGIKPSRASAQRDKQT
jgi:hypothetical protein